jgi:hypothetical protein
MTSRHATTAPLALLLAVAPCATVFTNLATASENVLSEPAPDKPASQPAEKAAEKAATPASEPPERVSTDPSITDNSVSSTRDQMAGRKRGGQEIHAVGAGDRSKPVIAYPEGTFLSRVEGDLLRLVTGDLVFAPDRTTSAEPGDPKPTAPPLILLPNLALQRLESALSSSDSFGEGAASTGSIVGRPRRAVISGEAFVYAGRVYLLTSVFSLPAGRAAIQTPDPAKPDPSTEQKPAADGPSQAPTADKPPAPSTDPSVQDLIRDLESRRAIPRAVDPTTSRSPGDASEPKRTSRGAASSVSPEGTLVESRRGRIIRAAGGGLFFVPDSNTTAATPSDAPMGLLPCKLLETIEARGGGSLPAEGRGDQTQFRVSGRVVVYRGRNYLLPTLAQLLPTTDVTPLQ